MSGTDLSSVMTTEAKIAMPEMVAIFLSKYETDLYDRKSELSKIISGIKQEIAANEKAARLSVSFADYEGLTIPKLDVVSTVGESRTLNWEAKTVGAEVSLKSKQNDHRNLMSKHVYKPIKKSFVNTQIQLNNDLSDRSDELSLTVQAITDMSRKERQIKGRISEMHLKEQGLEKFINSPEMAKLIKID